MVRNRLFFFVVKLCSFSILTNFLSVFVMFWSISKWITVLQWKYSLYCVIFWEKKTCFRLWLNSFLLKYVLILCAVWLFRDIRCQVMFKHSLMHLYAYDNTFREKGYELQICAVQSTLLRLHFFFFFFFGQVCSLWEWEERSCLSHYNLLMHNLNFMILH